MVRSGLGGLLRKMCPELQVYEVIKGQSESYRRLRNHWRGIQFDYIFCPHRSFRSAWFVSGLTARVKVGFWHWSTFWAFHHNVRRNHHLPEPLRVMQLLLPAARDLSIDHSLLEKWSRASYLNIPNSIGMLPILGTTFRSLCSQASWKKRPAKVALFPGSQWGSKQWPLDHYLTLSKELENSGFEVYWLGTDRESEELKRMGVVNNNLAGSLTL
ncbi:MAG: glycosyltransferase family 9 protein, partial [Bdellovibrionaceae bacterium]|nr:glycosyltransferase family 9 protein [Pseudobdellovibrionaceae bacterium]